MTNATFTVQKIDTGHGTMTVLSPQFQPDDLPDAERKACDALRGPGTTHHTGAIAVNDIAASQFEDGETVTLRAAVMRHGDAARESVKVFHETWQSVADTLAPVVSDLAEACRRETAEGEDDER